MNPVIDGNGSGKDIPPQPQWDKDASMSIRTNYQCKDCGHFVVNLTTHWKCYGTSRMNCRKANPVVNGTCSGEDCGIW